MEVIQELLKIALLGTEKINTEQAFALLPPIIQSKLSLLSAENQEEAFLQLSSFVLSYYQAGNEFPKEDIKIEVVREESVSYASEKASNLLALLLSENRNMLVYEWLRQCAKQSRIIAPQFLPQLLDLSKESMEFQQLLKAVMGERGVWLARMNADWQTILLSNEEIWEAGKAAQRKQLFSYLLKIDIQQAKTLLQNTWQQESAADRFDFLSSWADAITSDDINFLEKARQDKSKKVSELALQLLLKQPESSISQEIGQICSRLLLLKEGGVFGMGQKNITINEDIDLLPMVVMLDLEKESLYKTFSDQEYQAFQVLSILDPGFWEMQLGLEPEKILKQFISGKSLKKYLPAFTKAIFFYKKQTWAVIWLQNIPGIGTQYDHWQNDIFQLFPIASQETLLELFESKHFDTIITAANLIELLGSFSYLWTLKFSKIVLRRLYQNYADRGIYHYEMNEFLQISEYLHPDILNFKNEFLPTVDERRETWRAMLEELFRNIELKTKIQASFDA